LLESISRAQFELGDPASADATLAQLLDRLRTAPDAAQRISAWLMRVDIALDMHQIDNAKADLAQAEDQARLHGADARTQRRLANLAGHVALHDNRPDDARVAFDHYLTLATSAPDEPAQDVVAARLALAKIESTAGHRVAAQALLAAAFAEAASHPQLDMYRFGEVALYRANIEVDGGGYAIVASWLPATLAECGRALGARSSACRSLDAQLVRVLLKRGDAARAADAATALQSQMDDTRIPARQVEAAVLLARSRAWAGNNAQLQGPVSQLSILAGSAGVAPPLRLLTLNTLAEVSLLEGHPDDALAWVARSRELATREHLAGTREAAKTSAFEGAALQAQVRPELALRAFGAQCDEATLSASRFPVLDRLLSLNCARPLAAVGRMDAALELVSHALPLLREGLGKDAPTVLRAEGLLQELQAPASLQPRRKLDLFC
jgi:hypothetical protein